MNISIEELDLPENKLYFTIGETEEILDTPAHTLRYWEQEIDRLTPKTTPGGQRRYHRDDLELLVRIKYLVEEEKFTLAGAEGQLKSWNRRIEHRQAVREINNICTEALAEIQTFVENI
ncbi:MAG: MerR family transcriptional regulator [bacterium]